MNKLVKPILYVSSQITIAIFMTFLLIFKICLLVNDLNFVSVSVTVYIAVCLLFIILGIIHDIKTLVKLERENMLNFDRLCHRVTELEEIITNYKSYKENY